MLQSTVLSLSVLSDGNNINVSVRRVYSFNASTGSHVRIELKSLSEGDVERSETLSNGCLEGSLQTHFILPEGLQRIVGDEVSLCSLAAGVDVVIFEVYRHFEVVEDVNNSLRDLGTDSIARE